MQRAIKSVFVILTATFWLSSVFVFGQVKPGVVAVPDQSKVPNAFIPDKVQNFKLSSKLMARELLYRVILPDDYSTSNEAKRYPVVYLLHGLTGHFDNWTDKTKLTEYSKSFGYIIVTPEGNDGWYTDSAGIGAEKYESYIVKELIPEIDKKFLTIADRGHRAIAGLSMGGYGSIKFGLKYPEMFSLVGSFSGALGATSFNEKNAGAIGKSIDVIYGPDGSETRKANDIFGLARALTPESIKTLPFIYLDCGTEDFLFKNNRDFDGLLIEKKVPHEFRELPGAHNWDFWNSQVLEFLRVASRRIKN
jgi:S-formylglutathione hydrolase FrmB